ncbi:hypothetical protein L596_006391 [Steinernema carpocapsae]|uniref:Metalloendopeptidase n=1 Tax=Steinernema carpocapsae TaxID=34508 RepID=A0A4U8V440_STECR|nr:hypothetical protein L596_006391 [Steinernema carpocapsae]
MASGVWLLRCSILVVLLTVCKGRRSLWEINAHLGSDVLKSEGPKGDSRVMMAAIRKNTGSERWPGNVIPYQLSSNYNQAQTNEIDYLFIEPLDGCYSFVGRIGGEQKMSLAVDCLVDYIIWHEMLHVVGFEHEHQRPDRDRYIRVLFDNVSPDQIGNFDKIPDRDLERYDHEYDYKSIMHYDSAAFGMWDPIRGRRKQTMVPIRVVKLIDNMYLTQLDIKKLNDIGNCSVRQRSGLTSCVDKRNDCLSYLKTMQDYCAKTCNLCHGRL